MLVSLDGNTYYFQEEDKCLTAFTVTSLGFYEFNRLPLGLSNVPATYQCLMEKILYDLVNDFVKYILIDDIRYILANKAGFMP